MLDNSQRYGQILQESEHIWDIIAQLLTNGEIHAAVKLRRAEVRHSTDDEAKPIDPKDSKADERMLDIAIKIAKVLSKFPAIKEMLRFMEQRHGKECLCDSLSKLETLFQLCGGFESASLGETTIMVLDAILIMLDRGSIKDPAKITRLIMVGSAGKLGLLQRILKRCSTNKFLHEKFRPLLAPDQQLLADKFSTYRVYNENVPCEKEMAARMSTSPVILTWMSLRLPSTAALTNLQQRIWDGEMDSSIELAVKVDQAATTPLDWLVATDEKKTKQRM